MISQSTFNDAMQQINDSYAKLIRRIQSLESEVEELKKPKTTRKKEAA